jgi:hypothetical protein
MIAEPLLALVLTVTSTARLWQVESAGWERLAEECAAELVASRSEASRLRALQPLPALPSTSSTSPSWRPALLGGMAGAAIGGGAAAAIGCDEATCRLGGIAAGATVLVAVLVMLLGG